MHECSPMVRRIPPEGRGARASLRQGSSSTTTQGGAEHHLCSQEEGPQGHVLGPFVGGGCVLCICIAYLHGVCSLSKRNCARIGRLPKTANIWSILARLEYCITCQCLGNRTTPVCVRPHECQTSSYGNRDSNPWKLKHMFED